MKLFQSDKIKGKLRAIGRSSPNVNAARAEFDGSLALAEVRGRPKVSPPLRRVTFDADESIKSEAKVVKALAKGRDDAATDEIEVDVFAILRSAEESFKSKLETGKSGGRGRVRTLRGTLKEISELADEDKVLAIRLAETLHAPVALSDGVVESAASRTFSGAALTEIDVQHRAGEGVLMGFIDAGGYDFAHPDFLNPDGTTRFVRIWDQGGDFHDPPDGFDYGSEITDDDLNRAIQFSQTGGLPPQELEPQSQMMRGAHATHVASIAAGNSGLCSKAMIAGVLISIPPEDQDRRLSFYDSTRLVHAVDYLFELGEELGAKAVTINISLGTNGGPHDDSAPVGRWIDSALTKPGRAVCVSAGNAGQEAPQHAQDIGFIMGRIHTAGRIAAAGLEHRLDWIVVGNGIEDISENELEIWYEPQDRIAVQVRPPGGEWSEEIGPNEFIRNQLLPDGTFFSIFNELYDPGNGCNRISIYLSPFLEGSVVGVTPGIWTVRLVGREIRDGGFHGWIERDDPEEVMRLRERALWQFPSFFAAASNVDESSINSLACGARVIGVANYDETMAAMNITSSQGPTRDNRQKPDIAAPGTNILAANGFDDDVLWVEKTGTSMSSPYIAGVVGLLQSTINDPVTAAQIIGILRRTASPLPGHSFAWRNDAGFGAVNVRDALREAAEVGAMIEARGEA